MGLLSAISGNITAPESDIQASRGDATRRSSVATQRQTGDEVVPGELERTKSARSNYTSNTATTGRPPAPLVASATGGEYEQDRPRESTEILADDDNVPTHSHVDGVETDHETDVVPSSTQHPVVGTEAEADRGLVDQAVHEPATHTEYSTGEGLAAGAGVGAVGGGLLANSEDKGEPKDVPDFKGEQAYPASIKQSTNGDEPSRSYVKRNTPSVMSGRTGKTAQTATYRTVDYATASPANLHESAAVITLPAGGALHKDEAPGYEGTNGDAYPLDKKDLKRQSTSASRRSSTAGTAKPASIAEDKTTTRPASVMSKIETKLTSRSPSVHEGRTATRPATLAEEREQPLQEDVYAQQNGNGSPNAAALAAGGAVAGAGAFGLHQNQRQSQQDSSFGQERAMSPEPGQSIYGASGTQPPSAQRLAIVEPATNASNGPSPGPPITPIAPGAYNSGTLGRGNTVRSTASRGSTLRRGGGGTFANGAALQGQGVAEAYARDDIHERTEIADRNLAQSKAGQYSARKISASEAKDAKKLSRLIVREGKAEAKAVKASIEEIARLQKLQKKAAADELKAQKTAAKMAAYENRARMKFLKRKEAFERVEAEARVKQSDYEAKRQNASNQTDLLAEKTQELNDLRAQKAADDRERELKLLTLKNPGHA